MKKKDNITRILNSIKPIKKPFSKISKELNQSFKYSSLDNLIKILNKKQVYRGEFVLPPDKTEHKNDYDINFHNSIEYLNEFSDIKNLPLVANNNNYIIKGEFNPDYEIENIKRENNIKYFMELKELRKKEKIKKSRELLKKYKEDDSNLNLGKYNPNYNLIKPRIPKAFIRNPNEHIKNSWLPNCPFRNTFESFKIKEKEDNKNISDIKHEEKENKKIKTGNEMDKNTRNIINIKINENLSSYNNSQISQKTEDSINIPNIIYINNKKIKKIKIRKIKRLNEIYPEINNIKGQIVFDKMKKRKSLFKKCESNIDYFPNYKYSLPHTPSYIFKYIPNKDNYKKYINGKIIRGYNFNTDNYYVMQLRNKSI